MKGVIFFLTLILVSQLQAQELTLQQKIDLLNKENQQLQTMRSQIEDAKHSFVEVKNNTDQVLKQSSQNLQENMIRVLAGGIKDMFESIETCSNWISGVTLLTVKVVSYYRDQRMGNQIKSDYHNQQVNLDGIANNMQMLSDSNHDVYKKVGTLDYLVRLPLEYFDDDNQSLLRMYPEIAEYWKNGDGKDDDATELSTRKLNVLKNVSKKASDKLQSEISKMDNDIDNINSNINANNNRIKELKNQIDPWNAQRQAPEKITNNDQAKPEKVVGNSSVGWNDCLQIAESGQDMHDYEDRETWEKRLKEYHAKGVRLLTRLQLNIPDQVIYGEDIKYSYTYTNSVLQVPAATYQYMTNFYIDGKEVQLKNSKNLKPGLNTIVAKLTSCDKLIDEVSTTIKLIHPINEVEVYWEDPISEIPYKKSVSFLPKIYHPNIDNINRKLNYYFKYIFDDVEQDSRNNYKFTPHLSLLTPGKHEVTIQLYDGFTNQFVDQYLHHLTVLEPENGIVETRNNVNSPIPKQEKPDYSNMAGKRINALDLGWAKYDYLFTSNEVRIDGYYFWNNQKINYQSEPLKNYIPNATGVPGMIMTKTAAYHIYQTIDDGTSCAKYIITKMQGANIQIMHRLNACSIQINPAPDGSKITVNYSDVQNGPTKKIELL